MIIGNLAGLINGTETVIFDYEVTGSPISSVSTGNILNGNEDGWYKIIIFMPPHATYYAPRFRLNNDSGANYGYRAIHTTTASTTSTSHTGLNQVISIDGNVNNAGFSVSFLYAKNGAVRLLNTISNGRMTGTTVSNIVSSGSVWSNTVDNLTSITFIDVTGNLAVGTRLLILKSNNFTNGTPTGIITTPYIKGSWLNVGTHICGSNENSFTISSLDGNRDVLYLIDFAYYGGGASGNVAITINGDTANNYGRLSVHAASTSISRASGATNCIRTGYVAAANTYQTGQILIFAKSGFVRPVITTLLDTTTGTTIGNIALWAQSWNNTSSNITQFTFTDQNGTSKILQYSQFTIYALRPNG